METPREEPKTFSPIKAWTVENRLPFATPPSIESVRQKKSRTRQLRKIAFSRRVPKLLRIHSMHSAHHKDYITYPKTVMHPTWYALVNDYAIQLHRILTKCFDVADIVIVGAVRAMIRAHSIGHIMSDNGFYNFGWLKGTVVIICDVSHCAAVMRRGEFNLKVTSKFWSKPRLPFHPTTLEKH